jgi:hypothetical protein
MAQLIRNSGFSSHLQLVDLVPVICLTSSNRLRIEMLQAHMPTKFKTLGSGAPLVAGDNNRSYLRRGGEREVCCSAGSAGSDESEPAEIKCAKWRIYRFW